MGLDVYVMPLWRYKVGDFRSPIEAATGIRPKVVNADGIREQQVRVGCFGRWRARRQVKSICKAVEVANGMSISWVDEGGVVYSEQSGGFEALRAYARWLDCRDQFPEFLPPPKGNYHEHPVMGVEVSQPLYPHLVGHDCYNGYFLPCEFERNGQRHGQSVHRCDCYASWTSFRKSCRCQTVMS